MENCYPSPSIRCLELETGFDVCSKFFFGLDVCSKLIKQNGK